MKTSFVATTADASSWKIEGPLILAGSWCLPGLMHLPKRTCYEQLPYLWEKPGDIEVAEQYCWDVFCRLIPRLGAMLNDRHGVRFSTKYWTLVLGPWFLTFLNIAYDRYCIAQHIIKTLPGASTAVLSEEVSRMPPTNGFHSLGEAFDDDLWNLQIFSDLFRRFEGMTLLAHIPRIIPSRRRSPDPKASRSAAEMMMAVVHRMADIGATCLLDQTKPTNPKVLFHYSFHIRARHLVLIPFKLKGVWAEGRPITHFQSQTHMQFPRRSPFNNLSSTSTDPFETFVTNVLHHYFPICYLETYKEMVAIALKRYGRPSSHVVTDGPTLYADEPFTHHAASSAEEGFKIITLQHGGWYGAAASSPTERIEIETCDQFWTWGWEHHRNPKKTIPLPSPHLSTLHRSHHRNDTILFVRNIRVRYFLRFQTTPQGDQQTSYQHWAAQFLESLHPQMLDRVRYRSYYCEKDLQLPGILNRLDNSPQRERAMAFRAMRTCRLVVIDHPVTTMLEALSMNVPTVLFFNPLHWRHNTKSQPHFDLLHEAGILYYDPVEASMSVNRIYQNADEWWQDSGRQHARLAFCEQFARTSPEWKKEWFDALNNLQNTLTPSKNITTRL